MKTTTIQIGNKPMAIRVYEGIVSSNEKWTETHVSSHGGGGYINPQYGGHVSAAQVTSEVTSHRELWIKDVDSGIDISIEIPGYVPVADGHRVKFVEIQYDGRIWYPYFENLNSRKYWDLVEMRQFLGALTRTSIFRWMIAWVVICWICLMAGVVMLYLFTGIEWKEYESLGNATAVGMAVGIIFNAFITSSRNSSKRDKKHAEYQAFVKQALAA